MKYLHAIVLVLLFGLALIKLLSPAAALPNRQIYRR